MHLALCFHPLGNDGQIEPVSHFHHRFHDLLSLALVGAVHINELQVHLDAVHTGVLEHVQGGIPAAEIVHHHREALAVQAIDGVFHQTHILGHHALGDLHQQQPGLQLIALHQAAKDLCRIQTGDVGNGHIHRDGHEVPLFLLPAAEHLADALPHIEVQPGDQARFLQQGDKFPRGHDAPGGVVPAHEGFHAHDGLRHAVALGLQIEAELFVLQRPLQLAQLLLVLFELVQHGGQLLGQWCVVVVFLLFAPFLVALEVGFVNGRHAPLPFGVCSQKRLLMRQERILIRQHIQVRRSAALPFGHLVVSFSIRSIVRAGPTAHSVWS